MLPLADNLENEMTHGVGTDMKRNKVPGNTTLVIAGVDMAFSTGHESGHKHPDVGWNCRRFPEAVAHGAGEERLTVAPKMVKDNRRLERETCNRISA